MSDEQQQSWALWRVSQLRITTFPYGKGEFEYNPGTWWKAVAGEDPVSVQVNPRTNTSEETGPYLGGTLVFRIDPNRLECRLDALEDPDSPLELGPADSVVPKFVELIGRWLGTDQLPPLARIAFGAILLHSVATVEEGYGYLAGLLPELRIDPTGSSDLIYRINRPRASQMVDGLRVNRVSHWSVLGFRRLAVGPSLQTHVEPADLATRLVLDVNTAPDFADALPPRSYPTVVDELIALSAEIAVRGDVP